MKKLKGKVALVTGSSRGIGQQIAYGLAKLGCDVIIHGRELKNLDKTESMLQSAGVKVYKVAGNLGTVAGVKSVIDGVKKATGYIDILYNNAAIMNNWMQIDKISIEEWSAVFQVNIFAVISLCNAFVPIMKERKFGRVINLTSGIKEKPALAPYGVSKAAIDKYSQELAADCKETNVLVNYLDPGWLKTDMGGKDAMFEVETVLPGALVPALLEDNGPTGRLFCAQDFKYLSF